MAAADHRKAGRAVEEARSRQRGDGLLAGVDQVGVFLALKREWAHAEHAVFRLQRHVDAFGDEVRDQRRDADAEVHIETVFKFLCGACRHLVTCPGH